MSAIPVVAKGLLCLAAFAALDYVTFSPPLAPLGITPWNPAIGLAVAVVLVGGPSFAPLLVLGPLVSDIAVRALPFPWLVTALEAILIGTGYWFGLNYLTRADVKFDRQLRHLRDLLLLTSVTAVAAAFVALAYIAVLVAFGYLEPSRLIESVVRYWVGEMIGLMVMTPFLLLMAYRRGFPQLTVEGAVQSAAILAVVGIVVGIAGQPRLQLSFLLLLPIIWLAVRYGFEGVAAGLLMMQVCIMMSLHFSSGAPADVTLFQAIMVMLAVSGLAIGQLVSERSDHERRLRAQQEALAHAARVGSMGEFAAAMAHEINQPLTAAGNYARATLSALKVDTPRLDDARVAAEKLVEQVDRSAQVIRRLRELIRAGRLTVAPESVEHLLRESLDLMRPTLHRVPVAVDLSIEPALPHVAIDLIQIEQVVTNLVRNAVEALVDSQTKQPRVVLSARHLSGEFVEVMVKDNGPGLPHEFDIGKNRALASSKPDGLGVGLSLCQSIIDAHGGQLFLDNSGGGASIRFTLPIANESQHV